MTRAEHLQWVKDRAAKEIDFYFKEQGEAAAISNGIASFLSDMGEHEELRNHMAINLIMQIAIIKPFTIETLKKFINDTN